MGKSDSRDSRECASEAGTTCQKMMKQDGMKGEKESKETEMYIDINFFVK